jgi:hypothetical protein
MGLAQVLQSASKVLEQVWEKTLTGKNHMTSLKDENQMMVCQKKKKGGGLPSSLLDRTDLRRAVQSKGQSYRLCDEKTDEVGCLYGHVASSA